MYVFNKTDGTPYRTVFSPREIARMYCYDAWDDHGNRCIILTEETDFRTFEYQQ